MKVVNAYNIGYSGIIRFKNSTTQQCKRGRPAWTPHPRWARMGGAGGPPEARAGAPPLEVTMDREEFRRHGHDVVDWIADYYGRIESLPVRSPQPPGGLLDQLPAAPPASGEPMENILADFERLILPGITHWQHPSFFAYFPANGSFPSLLAEMLTAALGAQCMSWQTSPAATELEQRVLEWLAGMIGLPPGTSGVIQDSASSATLCALLTARERASDYAVNRRGLANRRFTVYCSAEAHSSVEKGVKIAGFGAEQLRKVAVDDRFAMVPGELERRVQEDRRGGFEPLAVVAAVGTTGSTAIDPLPAIGAICRRQGLWLHVDAAYAGTALLLPERRWMIEGVEAADSFVFNPHKWMFTHFDCSAYFVRDPGALVRTFEILPEYLKTGEKSRVHNYRDWGIPLGRRFRALKLWFVIRSFGVEGLQALVRNHIGWAAELADAISCHPDFELLAPVPLATVCFRYRPAAAGEDELERLNGRLLEQLNASGRLFLSHTRLNGRLTLRLVVGQTGVGRDHVQRAWRRVRETARQLG